MNAPALLARMLDDGFDVSLAANDALLLRPASRPTDEHRTQLRVHKAEIVELLRVTDERTQKLLAAAMRCCDFHADGDTARADMRRDILAIPLDERVDLLDHFDLACPAPPLPDAGTTPPLAGTFQGTPKGNTARVNSTPNAL